MIKEIEEVRKIFLTEVDEEVLADNEEKIREWEEGLASNEAYLSWQEHDITREIAQEAKDTFKTLAVILATNRTLTDEQRKSMWAKQDAMVWLLSLTERDAKSVIEQIRKEVSTALQHQA